MANSCVIPPKSRSDEDIGRAVAEEDIYETFTEEPITDQIVFLLGTCSTEAVHNLCDRISVLPEWIVIRVDPGSNILDILLQKLGQCTAAHVAYDTDIEPNTIDTIDKLLQVADEHGNKILLAIEGMQNTPQVQAFISAFQLWITNNRPIFFLASALPQELNSLQDEPSLTFLYRAPRFVIN